MATHSSVLAWRNPRDGGAWWAAVCRVTRSRAQLKRLSSNSSKLLINELLYQIILWNVSQAESSVLFQHYIMFCTWHQKYIIRFRYRYIVFQNIFPVWKVTVFSLKPFLLVHIFQFSSVAQLCLTVATPWSAAHQASLSITNSQSLLKLMSLCLLGRQILYQLIPPCCCCLVAKSLEDSLWPNGLQYARLSCPLLSPRVCSNSCHPAI